ncbi:hypothetical protein EUX98_g5038 [Antrodiella citrinella]|uniref:CDC20/Fizzy WD40 domain-containing protein n=1 Tax=Antrodiella citrinella TaxID=2447956 RepID=A0A4S4MSR5_9APHY|nr:hypothetical protein EUX98_g5038 [Antrodiella citrinella]
MAFQPKTPSRHRSRSEAKTPLTPSLLTGLNAISFASPTKAGGKGSDLTNPFFTNNVNASRSSSPVKRASGSINVSDSLQKQANTADAANRDEAGSEEVEVATNMDDVAANLDMMSLNTQSSSPGHTARLAAATGVPLNRRILSYHEAPPPSASDSMLSQQRELVRPLYGRPGALPTSTSTSTKTRKISTQPERVLDAPGIVDDFYLNLLSWSCQNVLAVALAESSYVWKADTGEVTQLGEAPEGTYISAVDFANDGNFLGVGVGTGEVELWDVETQKKLRTMTGHSSQVACLSWNQHVLSSGCGDGSIWHHDVRVAKHKVGELLGHQGEVCGLKWRSDGELLASGGNDNVVNVWDGRIGDVGAAGSRGAARWTKRNHTAAVKAVAWCPWQPSLLASGGGTNDATVHIWNTTTGARLHSLTTPSQVTSIQWSPHRKEFLTTHGFPTNALMIHAYPSMERVVEIRDAHDSRVLWSTLSPAGDVVCTGAGDENLKFWRVWEVPKVKKGKEVKEAGRGSTSSNILSIR